MPRKKQYQWDVETNGQEAPEQLSRSAKKRQSSALQDLGAELTKLPVNELDRLPLTPDLLEALRLYTRISNREGKRRQLQFIGRLMREVDAGPLAEAIEARKNGQQADAGKAEENRRDETGKPFPVGVHIPFSHRCPPRQISLWVTVWIYPAFSRNSPTFSAKNTLRC